MEFAEHLRTTGRALKNWAIAQALDSLAVGVLWMVGLYVLHVPWAPFWGLLAAVLQIVPHFGPILALIGPAIASGIAWQDWQHPLGVLILYAVVVVLDGFLLQPYLMRRSAKVPIWASILIPIALGIVWPFWGILVAPPLLAIVYAFRAKRQKESLYTPGNRGF